MSRDEEETTTLNEYFQEIRERMRIVDTKLNIILFVIAVEIVLVLWFLFWYL